MCIRSLKRNTNRAQIPEIEKVKEIMDQRREQCKPVRNKELKKFAKKYEKELKELESKKKDDRLNWYKNLGSGLPYKSKFEYNKFYHNFLLKEKQQKILEDHK